MFNHHKQPMAKNRRGFAKWSTILGTALAISTSSLSRAEDKAEASQKSTSYTVVTEDVNDIPIKTSVFQHIVLAADETFTEDTITAALIKAYRAARDRTGFIYHQKPTQVAVYLYLTEQDAEDRSTAWIGMIITPTLENAQAPIPDVDIREVMLKNHLSGDVMQRGLTTAQRKRIFMESGIAAKEASKEAENRYPPPYTGSLDEYWKVQKQQMEYFTLLNERKRAALQQKYGITKSVLDDIDREGVENHWPEPKY